jgi:hypothetical protein
MEGRNREAKVGKSFPEEVLSFRKWVDPLRKTSLLGPARRKDQGKAEKRIETGQEGNFFPSRELKGCCVETVPS